jgi:hypothetical protein
VLVSWSSSVSSGQGIQVDVLATSNPPGTSTPKPVEKGHTPAFPEFPLSHLLKPMPSWDWFTLLLPAKSTGKRESHLPPPLSRPKSGNVGIAGVDPKPGSGSASIYREARNHTTDDLGPRLLFVKKRAWVRGSGWCSWVRAPGTRHGRIPDLSYCGLSRSGAYGGV